MGTAAFSNIFVSLYRVSQKEGSVFWQVILSEEVYIYRVSQEECAILREGVRYVKIYYTKVERLRR
jgi:hypothetical protein